MKQVELYNHNKTTYENITRIFETSNKCATVQPTGSGKSFLIFKLAQDNSDKTIIVFEPNRQIIGRVSEQMKEYGIDNIKFYTYQKLNSQHKRDEISIANADYICLDELHRIKAKQWEQAVIAIQEKFPNAKVLGLTATPERMDGQNIIDYFGAELACNITLGDAIVNKILPCPTYISALYTFDEEIQKVSEKIDESRNSEEEKNEMRAELNEARKQLENALGVPVILKKHIPDNDGKYLVFCQNVEHLKTMKSVIGEWFAQAEFDVNMYEVHTKNPNHKTEYNRFQTDNSDCIKLCLCVDMFNEGVHLEGISGVILLRPTQSSIIYLQQIGRAISASDENVPIIFDLVNNGNSLGSGSLRTEIESAVERQREEIAETECNDNKCNKEVFDIGNFHIYDYVKDSLDVLNGIENKCVIWNNQYDEFEKIINHIKQYINSGNNLPIPYEYICEDGYKLGKKIMVLKTYKKRGTIKKEFEQKLSELGVELQIKNFDEDWNNIYNATYEYVHILKKEINQKTEYKGYKIGKWISTNKLLYNKGKLKPYRIEMLVKICDLRNLKRGEKAFENKLSIACEYFSLYKNIPYSVIYKGIDIGRWYNSQLKLYNNNKMPKDRAKKFQSSGLNLSL